MTGRKCDQWAQSEDYAARHRRAPDRSPYRPLAQLGRADRLLSRLRENPTERPAVVVLRVIAVYESGVEPLATCRACGWSLTADVPCPSCGVDPARWREVWQRTSADRLPAGEAAHPEGGM
jgi:hypothetical protein